MKRPAVRRLPLRDATGHDRQRELAGRLKQQARTQQWQEELRPRALRLIAARTARLQWSPALLNLLLEELHVEDFLLELIGRPECIPLQRYPQAIAVAIAVRHSWRRDDLTRLASHLGVKLTAATSGYR